MMQSEDYYLTFKCPPNLDALPYYKEDTRRALGNRLADLLETGERFTVRLVRDEPPNWFLNEYSDAPYMVEPPEFRYRLEIGAVHEREIEFAVVPQMDIALPNSTIAATPARKIAKELLRRSFLWCSYFTAKQRELDMTAFNEWSNYKI
jgi:hypothetical protein